MIIVSTPKSASSALSALFRKHFWDISYRSRHIISREYIRSTTIGNLHPEFDQKLDGLSGFLAVKGGPFLIKGHFRFMPKFISSRYVFLYREPEEILEAWERAYQKNIHPININILAKRSELIGDLQEFIDYHVVRSEFSIKYSDLIHNFAKAREDLAVYTKKDLDHELPRKKYSR